MGAAAQLVRPQPPGLRWSIDPSTEPLLPAGGPPLARFTTVDQSPANLIVRTGEVGSAAMRAATGRAERQRGRSPEQAVQSHSVPIGRPVTHLG